MGPFAGLSGRQDSVSLAETLTYGRGGGGDTGGGGPPLFSSTLRIATAFWEGPG